MLIMIDNNNSESFRFQSSKYKLKSNNKKYNKISKYNKDENYEKHDKTKIVNDFLLKLDNNIYSEPKTMAQLNTIRRIMKMGIILDLDDDFSKNYQCPHCRITSKYNQKHNYVICGYSNEKSNEIQIEGCGKDWCLKCGKILCKSWFIDELYDVRNRFHDYKCCNKDAKRLGISYEKYCKCNNIFVDRNKN